MNIRKLTLDELKKLKEIPIRNLNHEVVVRELFYHIESQQQETKGLKEALRLAREELEFIKSDGYSGQAIIRALNIINKALGGNKDD